MRNLAQESTENRRRSGCEGAAQLRGPQLRVAAESGRGPMKKMLQNQREAHVLDHSVGRGNVAVVNY
jgi:hypothetical protein